MDDIRPYAEIAAPEVLPSIVLDREAVRARVSAHLARGEPIEALGIERNRPVNTHDFAFVGRAPKRASQTNWYRCSFCQTDRKFSAGRIVLSSDGLLRLIGDDCWDKHLDRDRYRQEAQDWSDYEQKRLFARIREQIVPSIAFVTQKVREVLNESIDAIHFAEQLPHTLRIGAPLLFSRLEQAQRNGGRLQVERVVRDYGALERTGSERFVYRAEILHVVIGLEGALGPVPQIEAQLRETLIHFYNARNSVTE